MLIEAELNRIRRKRFSGISGYLPLGEADLVLTACSLVDKVSSPRLRFMGMRRTTRISISSHSHATTKSSHVTRQTAITPTSTLVRVEIASLSGFIWLKNPHEHSPSIMWKRTIPRCGFTSTPRRWTSSDTFHQPFPPDMSEWSHPPSNASISDEEVYRLAAKPRQPLTLADLVK